MEQGWHLTDKGLQQLENPEVKLFCLVNPSNPPSVKMNSSIAGQLEDLVNNKRPDLMIITDDVYGTFADDFCSLFALCPRNTFCVYSFSKYFGATGWRIGLIGLHNDNVFDDGIRQLPLDKRKAVNQRYQSISTEPQELAMIDRLVADSRTVALHHSAGLSTPQQLQMTLFALGCLIDQESSYKNEAKRLIRSRYETLYRHMGVPVPKLEGLVGYYTLLDLEQLAYDLYGSVFASWFLERHGCQDFLFRLVEETSIVLLPANGFEVHHPAVRVSLANLCLADYATIGRFTRQVLDEYFKDFSS